MIPHCKGRNLLCYHESKLSWEIINWTEDVVNYFIFVYFQISWGNLGFA